MMTGRAEVRRLERKLNDTFKRIDSLEDLEVRADFARYLCILVAGYVENALYELVLAYCRNASSPPVRSFVQSQLDRLTNVNSERLLQLIGSFDQKWREDLEVFITTDGRAAALNSLIALRHDVAHGGSAGISYVRVFEYYEKIEEIIDYLINLLDPAPMP